MTPSPVTTTDPNPQEPERPTDTLPWALEQVQPLCPSCGSAPLGQKLWARETAVQTLTCLCCQTKFRGVFWVWQGAR